METLEKAAKKCTYDTGEGYEHPNFNQAVECFVKGSVFGFENGAKYTKEEYEEKLRWIPVEEKLPESNKIEIVFKTKTERIYYGFYGLSCNFYVMLAELLDKNIQVNEVTHWRYFL